MSDGFWCWWKGGSTIQGIEFCIKFWDLNWGAGRTVQGRHYTRGPTVKGYCWIRNCTIFFPFQLGIAMFHVNTTGQFSMRKDTRKETLSHKNPCVSQLEPGWNHRHFAHISLVGQNPLCLAMWGHGMWVSLSSPDLIMLFRQNPAFVSRKMYRNCFCAFLPGTSRVNCASTSAQMYHRN